MHEPQKSLIGVDHLTATFGGREPQHDVKAEYALARRVCVPNLAKSSGFPTITGLTKDQRLDRRPSSNKVRLEFAGHLLGRAWRVV